MIENNENLKEKRQIQPQSQQPENEVFQSVSESSGQDEQQASFTGQDYTLTPIAFPSPEPNTLRLLDIYQQNTQLISKLKSQISRLSEIKKENLFIKDDCVKISFQQEESEFFLRSKELYKERQQQLQKIKNEIRSIDQQQLTTLMSKNQNILNLAQIYFSKFRNIIDAKIYGQELVLLTQEKKKVHQKKKKRIEQQELLQKLYKNNSRSRSGMKNSQQKINTVQDTTKNEQQQSENGSKISTPRKRQHQKFNSIKRIFNIRFVQLTHLFPELQIKPIERQTHCFKIGTKTDSVPRSFVYDIKNKLFLVMFSTNIIHAYTTLQESQEQIKEQHSISHKSHSFGHNKLRQISDFKIEFDKNLKVMFFQLRDSSLFLSTSDGIMRLYEINFDSDTKKLTYEIKNIVFCLDSDQLLGQIQFMTLNDKSNEEIYFITDNKKLCKLNLQKYKTEIIRKFDQKVVQLNENYIETGENIYLNYVKTNYQHFVKEKFDVFKENDDKEQETLKICSFKKEQRIYFIKVDKHGLLSGYCEQV